MSLPARIIFALMLTAPAYPAMGQGTTGAMQLRRACAADYKTFCAAGSGEGERQAAIDPGCLRQYWTNLSRGCRTALKQREQQNETLAPSDE